MDHDREVADDPTLRERHAKYIADLVVCALRASNTFPGGVVDLQAAVEARITTKNAAPTPRVELVIGCSKRCKGCDDVIYLEGDEGFCSSCTK